MIEIMLCGGTDDSDGDCLFDCGFETEVWDEMNSHYIQTGHSGYRLIQRQKRPPTIEVLLGGALKSCIAAHGPITIELIPSAVKRLKGILMKRDIRRDDRPPTHLQVIAAFIRGKREQAVKARTKVPYGRRELAEAWERGWMEAYRAKNS